MIVISSCLAGINCKYDGGNNLSEKIVNLVKKGEAILVCPEQLGGLSTPRIPSEIDGNKVFSKEGTDVTDNFKKGAEEALKIAQFYNVKVAILKEKSPSCGSNFIYNGQFSGELIKGEGVTAKLFKKNGIIVYNEDDWEGIKPE